MCECSVWQTAPQILSLESHFICIYHFSSPEHLTINWFNWWNMAGQRGALLNSLVSQNSCFSYSWAIWKIKTGRSQVMSNYSKCRLTLTVCNLRNNFNTSWHCFPFPEALIGDKLYPAVSVKGHHPRQAGHTPSLLPPCILNLPQTPPLASPSDRLARPAWSTGELMLNTHHHIITACSDEVQKIHDRAWIAGLSRADGMVNVTYVLLQVFKRGS